MNKLLLKYIISITIILCLNQFSFAATDIINAKIIDVAPDKDYGVVYVKFDTTQSGTTACVSSTSQSTYQINDLGMPIADALLSTALTALASGKPVKAVGTGTCDGRQGIETLRLITFVF